MADWNAEDCDEDGEGWEDVAAAPSFLSPPKSRRIPESSGSSIPPVVVPASNVVAVARAKAAPAVTVKKKAETVADHNKVSAITHTDDSVRTSPLSSSSSAEDPADNTTQRRPETLSQNQEQPVSHHHPDAINAVKKNRFLAIHSPSSLPRDRQQDTANSEQAEQKIAALKATVALNDKKIASLTRERDALRLAREARSNGADLAKEKDKQIAAVMAEGEALSVKIAEKEAALKIARSKIKDLTSELDSLRLSQSASEAKVQSLASKQRTLETAERAAQEGREAAEKRLRQLESDLRTKSSSSAALEAARAQLESLRKTHATALEDLTMRLRAEADAELSKVRANYVEEENNMNKAIAELRMHLKQVTENAGWKEEQLRKEIEELRSRAESLELRNEELAQAVPGATRPLLRQVEALQAAAQERSRALSAVERSQLERLRQAQAAVAAGAERERAAEERIGTLLTRIASLEEQGKLAQSDMTRISSELREARNSAAVSQLDHQRFCESAQVASMKMLREKEAALDELSKARAAHLDDMEAAEERERRLSEKVQSLEAKLETMQARLVNAQAVTSNNALSSSPRLRREDAALQSDESTSLVVPSPRGRVGNFDHMFSPRLADEDMQKSGKWSTRSVRILENLLAPGERLSESASTPGGVYDSERLHLALRQRTEEIESLQSQLESKEVASQALADEVVLLAARVEELTTELKDAPKLRKEFENFKVRHMALLELHGEREERVLELEADLADINLMYKEQITELLLKLERQT